jgi:Rad3-related DNA helicase
MASVPLPEWVQDVRPHQVDAVEEAVQAYESGVPVVMMDAPTGSGKTLIAELIRRRLNLPTLYVASDNSLVDQVARDFPYAKLLKGKRHYRTQNDPYMTADDCTSRGPGSACYFCDERYMCPYQQAKEAALTAPLAVTNTSFLLTEANKVGKFSGRKFVVADEADTLESMLMGFVEYNVSAKRIRDFGMDEPGKGVHKQTLVAWLDELSSRLYEEVQKVGRDASPEAAKTLRSLSMMYEDTKRVSGELSREISRKQAGESEGKWLRDYNDKTGGLILKPVMVDSFGTRNLWRHSKQWLLMSATIISSDEMADSLGLPLEYHTVKVPMTFPVENRPVILAPVANCTYKDMKQAIPRLVKAISVVCDKHPGDRIMVHTVSYHLAKELMWELRKTVKGRKFVSYSEGAERESALLEYKRTPGAVMLAPSMGRGIDLPGDLCRVQVIAKVPFLSLGDRQVSARTHLPGGDLWYAVQAIRDVVQMTGRGVRSKDDHAVTYIFDQQFAQNLWRKHKGLFPEWWRESVITNQSVREFLL